MTFYISQMKSKIYLTAFLPLFWANLALANNEEVPDSSANQNQPAEIIEIASYLDSLSAKLFQPDPYDSNYVNPLGFKKGEIPVYSDSVYAERIGKIPSIMPLTYNDYVRNFVRLYVVDRRPQVEKMLGMQALYFPMIEEKLDARGLPIELKYLAIIESALNPNARSKAGATGLWQIMYSTAKLLGLNMNSYIDERRDPFLSTDAALDYLEDLYAVYDDWFMVIAAYNCGPGNVNKAIRRSGGQSNYWKLRKYLPRETRGYVPAFIAATYAMSYYEEHNLQPGQPLFNYSQIDTIHVYEKTSLERIAKFTESDLEELVFLNSALKHKIIPATKRGYALKIPLNYLMAFENQRDSIFAEPKLVVKAEPKIVTRIKTSTPTSYYSGSSTTGKTKLIYEIKNGDNLGFIAEWYDCKAQDIRNWNGMYGSNIRVGMKLKIYVSNAAVTKFQEVNSMTFEQKQTFDKSGKSGSTTATAAPVKKDEECNCVYHKVKSGDTLWDIAKLYPGVTIEKLKKSNNITNSYKLKPGMILKVEI